MSSKVGRKRTNIIGAEKIIRKAIKDAGKTEREISVLMEVDAGQFSKWMTGRRSISKERIFEIAKYIGRDEESFFEICKAVDVVKKTDKNKKRPKKFANVRLSGDTVKRARAYLDVRVRGVGEILREETSVRKRGVLVSDRVELAWLLGVHETTLHQWFNGRRTPTIRCIMAMAKAVKIKRPEELVLLCLRHNVDERCPTEKLARRNQSLIDTFASKERAFR